MRALAVALVLALGFPVIAQEAEPVIPPGLVEAMRANASPITGQASDYDPLIRLAAGARLVFIGEATHGTAEFYRERARITKKLMTEMAFDAVVVEADWPEADRVDRWVRLKSPDGTPEQALSDFQRFPTWVWRNREVRDFIVWQRERNASLAPAARSGFHGMDMQNLEASTAAVLRYLEGVNPAAAGRAREAYACTLPFAVDGANDAGEASCAAQTASALAEVRAQFGEAVSAAEFSAERSALVAQVAEQYGRLFDPTESWNLRDRFMMSTLDALMARYSRSGHEGRLVVWTHNSHVGDARASELGGPGGEVTVGELAREEHGRQAVLVGMTTVGGTVLAAPDWDAPAQAVLLRPALANSIAQAMSLALARPHLLVIRDHLELQQRLRAPLLERAVGVIYAPESERQSHYFVARAGERWDVLIHIPQTSANQPLDRQ